MILKTRSFIIKISAFIIFICLYSIHLKSNHKAQSYKSEHRAWLLKNHPSKNSHLPPNIRNIFLTYPDDQLVKICREQKLNIWSQKDNNQKSVFLLKLFFQTNKNISAYQLLKNTINQDDFLEHAKNNELAIINIYNLLAKKLQDEKKDLYLGLLTELKRAIYHKKESQNALHATQDVASLTTEEFREIIDPDNLLS
jgi:hypothetical protein